MNWVASDRSVAWCCQSVLLDVEGESAGPRGVDGGDDRSWGEVSRASTEVTVERLLNHSL